MEIMVSAWMGISIGEWFRMISLYAHLLFCGAALTMVLREDWRIATGNFSREELESTARVISILLAMLWLSGLIVIYLDTGFDWQVLSQKSKLLLKLISVGILTINGYVLHRISFPVLTGDEPLTVAETTLLATTGALSTSHWLMAAFIGLARPLGRLPLESLLLYYAGVCIFTLLVALLLVPVIRRHLTGWRLENHQGLVTANG